MHNKPRDIAYCNANEAKVLSASPELNWENVYYLKKFITNRYKIKVRKDVQGKPAPWTKDPILQEFKFTNIRREDDRQSKYLIQNVSSNRDLSLEDKIVNSFMFRMWNNLDTFRDFGFPYEAYKIYSPKLKEKVRPIYHKLLNADPDRYFWTRAYFISSYKKSWKFSNPKMEFRNLNAIGNTEGYPDYEEDIPLRPFHVGVWLKKKRMVERLLNAEDQLECYEIIKELPGFSDFLAYQVFVDLTYIEEFPFSENEFSIAGPGCKCGLDFIFSSKDNMTYEEALFWLRNAINSTDLDGYKGLFNCRALKDWCTNNKKPWHEWNPEKLFCDLPLDERYVNLMSLENCMCELSKYLKVLHHTGKARMRYENGTPAWSLKSIVERKEN